MSAELEEVVVTATRRSADVQDVAIPMTAVTGDALERTFAQDLRDLTGAAPNVSLEPVGIFQNSASFFIRGQGSQDIESTADSKVAILIDGVLQARVSSALSDMIDVEAVEILRGPQGTLFGRNTVAGAVHIRNNAPKMDTKDASFSAQVGDFGRFDVKGMVNFPIIEGELAARIAAKSTQHDGYWENDFNGKDRSASDRLTVLPSLKWEPNDQLSILVRGEYNKTRDDTYLTSSHHYCRDDPGNFFTNFFLPPDQQLPTDNDLVILTQTLYSWIVENGAAFTPEAFADSTAKARAICGVPIDSVSTSNEYKATNTEDRGQGADLDIWGITTEINYNMPDIGTWTFVGNYREVDEDIIFTIDVAPHDLFAGLRSQEHEQTSLELRFASEFSDTFDFVTGVYYFEQEYTMLQQSYGLLFEPNVILTAPSATPAITFTSPVTNGQGGWSNQKNDAWAVFLQGNWHVTDKLTLTAGGRYTDETKDFTHCGVGAGDPTASFGGKTQGCNNVPAYLPDFTTVLTDVSLTPRWGLVPAIGFDASGGVEGGCIPVLDPTGGPITCNNRLQGSANWTEFTPMAGLSYDIADNMMVFVTYSEGFKSGGFNGRATSPSTIGPFNPEKGENWEIGFKSEWFDNRLRFNINAFRLSVADFQQGFIRPTEGAGGQETVTANLGEIENQGVEIEITAVPMEGLTLWGNLGYLDTEQKGFCTDGDGFSGTDPTAPPATPGPFSGALAQCAPAEIVTDAIGTFLGWLVPTDNSNLLPGPRAPEWTLSLGAAYEWQLGGRGSLMLAVDWLHRSDMQISASRATELKGVQQYNGDFLDHFRDDTDIVNASLIWRSPQQHYQVSVFGKNLTDELYNQATTNVGGLLEFRVPNIRKHYGVEFSYQM
ncbi:MAG: TonB-dependent receptor [Gammaproteobacteria bacterium]|nr:TonB-dependent receptor [Gammaproteobacteria bacterium]MBT4495023.1 TonB-dependent receptor [Gammaproteobacteria bacterium]MBT7369260.1 TonB-dependent receptor [Gammaproteobacteria bacterium]